MAGDERPDGTSTKRERARAQALGDRVDELLLGVPRPPVMPSDERWLLETATVIRASVSPAPPALSDPALASVVNDALGQTRPSAGAAAGEKQSSLGPANTPAPPRARRASLRAAPWALTVASAAAALVLALRPTPAPAPLPTTPGQTVPGSRPTDALVGRIPAAESHLASERADAIFADRMTNFRARRWARGGRP